MVALALGQGRSCHKALSRVWKGLRRETGFVVDADIREVLRLHPP